MGGHESKETKKKLYSKQQKHASRIIFQEDRYTHVPPAADGNFKCSKYLSNKYIQNNGQILK